jgi:hypothetical protein
MFRVFLAASSRDLKDSAQLAVKPVSSGILTERDNLPLSENFSGSEK